MPCNCSSSALTAAPSLAATGPGAAAAAAAVEALCQHSMNDCQSVCFTDTRDCSAFPNGCNGQPIAMAEPAVGSELTLERCCDENGCCALYPSCCRNPFWPHFSHPTWLCCRDLYGQ